MLEKGGEGKCLSGCERSSTSTESVKKCCRDESAMVQGGPDSASAFSYLDTKPLIVNVSGISVPQGQGLCKCSGVWVLGEGRRLAAYI